MMIKRLTAILMLIAMLLLAVFAIYVNVDNLIGAFGSGPPYFSRTTNMDKWANPLPFLLVFDVVAVGILVGAGCAIRRLLR